MKRSLLILFICLNSVTLSAMNMHMIAPYLGSLTNTLTASESKLEDNGLMKGIYLMWVNPEKFQTNLFFYGANEVNSSDIVGNHFIFDYYLKHSAKGRYVLGAGLDWIQIKTDASSLAGVNDYHMKLNVYAPYVRAGRYFNFKQKHHRYSVLVWSGFERDLIKGDNSFKVIIPPMEPTMPQIILPIENEFDETYDYALAGIALKTTFFHFLEFKAKFHRKFSLDDNESSNVISVMSHVFLNRKWGLSYRFKTMKATYGEDQYSLTRYHIGGVVYVF